MTELPEEAFARHASEFLSVTPAQLESARRLQSEARERGEALLLSEALIRQGSLSGAQAQEDFRMLEELPAENTAFGAYHLIRRIGSGGMGVVFLAEHHRDGERVAVKVLPKGISADADAVQRFRQEAAATARLAHPNLIAYRDAGECRGHLFYVMEYVDGVSLDRRLQDAGALPWRESLRIATGVAQALGRAHDQGFIHRDIKPSNILLCGDGTPKVLDLGLSKDLVNLEASFRTATGVVLGTPLYMAPEQAQAARDLDGRADIYSLGCTLYHLLTGRPPFTGATMFEILAKHLGSEIEDPRKFRSDIPKGLYAVLRRMLAKLPRDRYRDCAELRADFERIMAGQAPAPTTTRPSGSLARRGRTRKIIYGTVAALAFAGMAIAIRRGASNETAHVPPPPIPPAESSIARPEPSERLERRIPGLLAQYRLDEDGPTAKDRNAGQNGIRKGSVVHVVDVPPPLKDRASFAGSTRISPAKDPSFVELPAGESLNSLNERSYTLSIWIKPLALPPGTGPDSSFAVIMKSGMHEGLSLLGTGILRMEHWVWEAQKNFQDIEASSWGHPPLQEGIWHHVAGVVDAEIGEVRCYLNGTLCKRTKIPPSSSSPRPYGETPWRIGVGSLTPGSAYRWQANIQVADARFYDRTLSDSDLSFLAAGVYRDDAVNLIAGADPTQRPSNGTAVGIAELRTDPAAGKWIELSYDPPLEYDLVTEFTRTEGRGPIVLKVGCKKALVSWTFGSGTNEFREIRGGATSSGTLLAKGLPLEALQNGHRYESRLQVRKGGIRALLDQELVGEVKFDPVNPAPVTAMTPNPTSRLILGSDDASVTFHVAEVTELTGQGTHRAPARPRISPVNSGFIGAKGDPSFSEVGDGPLIGLRVSLGSDPSQPQIKSARPIYRRSDGTTAYGQTYGRPSGEVKELVARPGFALAGITGPGGARLIGLRAVFMRISADGQWLDPSDRHESDWIGGGSNTVGQVIVSAGAPAVGVAGRCSADIGSLGLKFLGDGSASPQNAAAMASFWKRNSRSRETSESGLSGYWPMNESAGETVAAGNTCRVRGRLINGPLWNQGVVGTGLGFSGGGDRVQFDDFAFDANAFTVSAWVNHTLLDNRYQRYLTMSAETAVLRHGGLGVLEFYARIGDHLQGIKIPGALAVGDWCHVAGTWDGEVLRLYKDGKQLGMKAAKGRLAAAHDFELSSASEGMRGSIDELRIFDRALSAEEIGHLAAVEKQPASSDNVLESVDPARNPHTGNWVLDRRGLTTPPGAGELTYLKLPYIPPDEYEVLMEVERIGTDFSGPSQSLDLGLCFGGRQFTVVFGSDKGLINTFNSIDGKWKGDLSQIFRADVFKSGKKTMLRVEVRKEGVRVSADGSSILEWKEYPRLSCPGNYFAIQGNTLFLGSRIEFRITRLTVTPITGKGTRIR